MRHYLITAALLLMSLTAQAKDIPPLPDPDPADVVTVSTSAELLDAVANAVEGQTIMIAAGTHYVYETKPTANWGLVVNTSNITIRGATDNAADTILMGRGFTAYSTEMIILNYGVHDITIANLTIKDVGMNGIKIQSGDVDNVLVHNVHLIDIRERYIKGPNADTSSNWEIRYCLIEQIRELPFGDYVGGIDTMQTTGWHVHDNTFKNIRGTTGAGRGAIFFWQNNTGVIVERNTFIGCDRSIAFGNPSGLAVDVSDSIIRNNFIYCGVSQAIELAHAFRIKVYNNSMYHMDSVLTTSTIKVYRDQPYSPDDDLDFINNIIFSTRNENDNDVDYMDDASRNLYYTTSSLADTMFADHTNGDFHLTAAATDAINQGETLADVTDDWDLETRVAAVNDMGADEYDGPGTTDTDSIPDAWELYFFGDLTTADDTTDSDGDGASDLLEFLAGGDAGTPADSTFDPTVIDFTSTTSSDGDSLPDIWEYSFFADLDATDSENPDSDSYTNLEEYTNGTDPLSYDSASDICPGPAESGCRNGGSGTWTMMITQALIALFNCLPRQ